MNTAQASAALRELAWIKSSYSGAEGGQCVEVAATSGAVLVRDSKVSAGPVMNVTPKMWAGFVRLAAGSHV